VASKVRNNLAADGSHDNLIKIEGLDTYSFKDVDAAWGVTKECPNPTPKEAEKAKAYAARNAWTRGGRRRRKRRRRRRTTMGIFLCD